MYVVAGNLYSVSFTKMDAETAFTRIKRAFPALSDVTLKSQQLRVLDSLLSRRHTLAVWPTGYGKTLIFAIFPLLKDEIDGGNNFSLIISPQLTALMREQQAYILSLGIPCGVIAPKDEMTPEEIEQLKSGNLKVVIASPEVLLDRGSQRSPPLPWQQLFQRGRKDLSLLAFDEAHVVPTLAADYDSRKTYAEVGGLLRSLFVKGTVLLTTATLTEGLKVKMLQMLHLEEKEVSVFSVCLDRPNIALMYTAKKQIKNGKMPEPLKEYIEHLRNRQKEATKAIIYCRTINTTSKLWVNIMSCLGEQGRYEDDQIIVGMYHPCLGSKTEKEILSLFKNGTIRCLVSCIAFGIGVNIPDIRQVFHYGPPKSILEYWQEVGQCAVDGLSGKAVLLGMPLKGHGPDPSMKALLEKCEAGTGCFRQGVLKGLWPRQAIDQPGQADQCCSICLSRQ